jgi:TolA-binding protein
MREGSVLISGPGIKDPVPVVGGQRFKAGEDLERDLEKKNDGHLFLIEDARTPESGGEAAAPAAAENLPAAAADTDVAQPAVEAAPAGREERTSPAPRSRKAVTAAPTKIARVDAEWRTLAARAQYKEALDAAIQDGWRNNCNRLGAEDVVLLGDVARLAGDLERAEDAYRIARRRFPSADRPVFALGRMAFERRHDYAAAASWFDSYVQLFPQGPLVREAAGRLLEARLKAGDDSAARVAAASYLRAYPTGPHAALARRTVGP